MKIIFKANEKNNDQKPLKVSLVTNNIKYEEIPKICFHDYNFSHFIAGLLNAFYNGIDISDYEEGGIIELGKPD